MSSPWLLLALLFVLGTIVGSFLNVVIYRLPLGKGLIYPGSRCPACGHPIRWYDNVPLLGWLWLRGRCRDCGAAISPRYPLVETAVGLLFAVLGWFDLVIPYGAAREVAGEGAAVATDLFVVHFVYHLLLLCPLLAAAVIETDGLRLPRRLITLPSAAAILLAMWWPMMQRFPLHVAQGVTPTGLGLNALVTAFVGMVAAVVARVLSIRFLGSVRLREIGLVGASLALYAVGAFLGWQAVAAIGLLATIWSLSTRTARARSTLGRLPATWIVFAAALAWCLLEWQFAIWL